MRATSSEEAASTRSTRRLEFGQSQGETKTRGGKAEGCSGAARSGTALELLGFWVLMGNPWDGFVVCDSGGSQRWAVCPELSGGFLALCPEV